MPDQQLSMEEPATVVAAEVDDLGGAERGSEAGIVDVLRELALNKKKAAVLVAVGGFVMGMAAFHLPNTYTAMAALLPPQQQQANAAAMLGQLGPLTAAAARDMGLKSPGDLYVGLLGSRSIADAVIARFSLMQLYKAKTMVDARSALHGHARFSAGKDSLVRIEVDDTEPARAAAIANEFVAQLNRQSASFGTNEASQRRRFLEKQVNDEREALALAEEAMKKTQIRTGIVQVESQTTVAIASVAQIKAEITAAEVELARLKMGATAENPEVMKVETQMAALQDELKRVESSPRAGDDPMVPVSSLPNSGLEYLRGLRDLKYHEFLFEMLSKQYEAARIDEAKDVPTLQVVDSAVAPDKKSGPHRGLLIAFGMLAGLFVSVIVAYWKTGSGRILA